MKEEKCYICKTSRKVAPKIIKTENIQDEKFARPILTVKTLILCDKCYKDIQEGKVILKSL